MNTPEFNACLKDMQAHTVDVLTAKAAEYATDDRLHNFKAAAALERTDPVSALAGMMAKHTISVYDLVHDQAHGADISLDLWAEKITDSINYLYLLWALLNETQEDNSESGIPTTDKPVGKYEGMSNKKLYDVVCASHGGDDCNGVCMFSKYCDEHSIAQINSSNLQPYRAQMIEYLEAHK